MTQDASGERLDEQCILEALPAAARACLRSFTLLSVVDSTNRFLLEHGTASGDGVEACAAECQTAGRGRRGRAWISPDGANLYLSVLRAYATPPEPLSGLSLAVGVAVVRALQTLGVRDLALKWPNDLQIGGKKLGGILLEMSGSAAASWRVVAGVGINVAMPADAGADIDQPWTDLAAHGLNPGRNHLASRVLAEIIAAGAQFAAHGFQAFRAEWQALDALRDRELVVSGHGAARHGTARGVDADGALLLETDGCCERIVSGDVSLRPAT